MPFTTQQFFEVFSAYNAAIWPAQVVAYALGLAAVVSLLLVPEHASRFIAWVLALMWLWNGVCYHWLAFSPINPAAKIFAVVFLVQAVLLTVVALSRQGVSIRARRDIRSVAGFGFVAFAMFIYPALGFWAGHGLMGGPMFGVAPCPTTIFTMGLLLLMRGRGVAWLSVIPLLWSLIGLAAALQLGMIEDLALPVAGIVLVVILAAEALRARQRHDPFVPLSDRVAL